MSFAPSGAMLEVIDRASAKVFWQISSGAVSNIEVLLVVFGISPGGLNVVII
jgi:hypothetical protein